MVRRSVVSALVASGLALSACSGGGDDSGADDPIKIAIFPATSGPLAVVGESMEHGAQLAVDVVNEAGGIDGRQVELVTYETDGQPATTLQLVRQAVTADGVDLIAGIGSSPEVIAVQPQLAALDAVLVNSTSKADDILATCDANTIVTAATNTMSVRAVTDYVIAETDVQRWAAVATDSASGRAAVDAFVKEVEAVGGEVSEPVFVAPGTADFGPVVSTLQGQDADALFASIYGGDAVGFMKQAEQFGALDDWPTIAGQAFVSDLVWDAVGPAAAGVLNNVSNSGEVANELMDEFQEAYEAEFDATPNYIAGEVYIGMQTLFAAIEAAGTDAAAKVATASRGLTFDSIVGDVTIREEDGLLVRPDYVGRVVDEGDGFAWEILSTSEGADIVPAVSGC